MQFGLINILMAWGPDTCQPGKWNPDEPSTGQCAPTALLVQDIMGGDIYTCKVGRVRHYFNGYTRDGGIIDLTRGQFGGEYNIRDAHPIKREQLLRHHEVRLRYELLRARAEKHGRVV